MSEHDVIRLGSTGDQVVLLQRFLKINQDGDFGPNTEAAVRNFQTSNGLVVDGVVGSITWSKLEEVVLPPQPVTALDIAKIISIAHASRIAHYDWMGRGSAPVGYTKGVALSYASALLKLRAGDQIVRAIAAASTGNSSKDALAHYAIQFAALGMHNDVAGEDTLRHVFVLLLGLGMRESSGKYCEGRDMSASNVNGSTCEAGAWQMSLDARGGVPLLGKLINEYEGEGFALVYREGVQCSSNSWKNWGQGPGLEFQKLCKAKPDFAALACALGMRTLRTHWGPLNRHEASVRREADDMFRAVAATLDGASS